MREIFRQGTIRESAIRWALTPGTQNFASHPAKRIRVTRDDPKASRQGDCGDQRVAQGQRPGCLCSDLAPNGSGARIEIKDAILAGQFGNKRLDVGVIGMVGLQRMKALPRFRQGNRRNEQTGCVLARVPGDHTLIRARLSDFTDEIRVENEAHKVTRPTRSSGMRGISQSVVPRMESYQAMSCCVVRADVRLRRRARTLAGGIFWNCSSQAKSLLACFGDKRLTSLMAISTALTSKICACPQIGARIESATGISETLMGGKSLNLMLSRELANRSND
jgi:hypothetical protein